jgi:hypothetical protein
MENNINELPAFEDTIDVDPSLPAFDETTEYKEPGAEESGVLGTIKELLGEAADSTGATLVGAGQGATFNFGDEILAALEYAGRGGQKPYQDIQKEYEKAYAALREKHPISTMAGEIGGGFLVPGGAVVKAGKMGAGLGGKILSGALAGGISSGIAELGATEKDISKPEEFQKELPELKEAALFGAGLGGAIPVAGAALKPLKDEILKSPIVQRWLEAYRLEAGKTPYVKGPARLDESSMGKKGMKSGPQRVLGSVTKLADKLSEDIIEQKNLIGNKISEVVESRSDDLPELMKNNDYVQFVKLLQQIPKLEKVLGKNLYERFFKEETFTKKVLTKSGNIVEKNYTRLAPKETSLSELNFARKKLMENFNKKTLREFGLSEDDIGTLKGYDVNDPNAIDLIDSVLDEYVPELGKLRKDFQASAKVGETVLNEIKNDPDFLYKKITSMPDEKLKPILQKIFEGKIKSAGSISAAGDVAMKDVFDILESMKSFNKKLKSSETLKELDIKPYKTDKIRQDIESRAKGYAALVGSKGIDATQDVETSQILKAAYGDVGAIRDFALKSGLHTAGKIGRFETSKLGKTILDPYKNVRQYADKMAKTGTGGTKKLGEVLKTALDNKMAAGSVSALNSLLQQNAEAREAFKKIDEDTYPEVNLMSDENYPNVK